VVYAHRAAVPVTRVLMSFDAGAAADPDGKLGTQSLTLSLLKEGTTSLTSTQIAEAGERLGATIGTGASADRTYLLVSSPSPNLGGSLDLFADVVRHPAFAPAEVERLRASLLTNIASELVDPSSIANRAMPTLLYGPGHPYAKLAAGSGDCRCGLGAHARRAGRVPSGLDPARQGRDLRGQRPSADRGPLRARGALRRLARRRRGGQQAFTERRRRPRRVSSCSTGPIRRSR
jgi:hypothetical protein